MENEMTNDSNPALIDIYLKALLMRESTNNYEAKHKASIIKDYATGKPIRVQALGGYGILDINFEKWAEQAGLQEFSMEDEDWKDPVAQDTIARYKVQEYFNKYNSWDAVSIAWFSGEGNANKLVRNGTIDYTQADSNGVNIKDYVASMNNLISEELMNIEVPTNNDMLYRGEPKGPSRPLPQIGESSNTMTPLGKQKDMQQVFAAQILDAMTKANAGGMRPSFESQVPAGAGDFSDAVVEAKVKRGEIR
jgi:hypothetical protein